MKILFILIISFFSISQSFLTYPFLAEDLVNKFLGTLKVEDNNAQEETPGAECSRECKENDSRICRFNFMMKYFQVMGG